MATVFCILCEGKFNARPHKSSKPNYIPICSICRRKPTPDEFRCRAISGSTNERCKSWADFDGNRCGTHRRVKINE